MEDKKEAVKYWYDGFTFGKSGEICTPWSVLNYLKTGEFSAYWANTSSNSLVSVLLREGNKQIKQESSAGGRLPESSGERACGKNRALVL